MTFQKTIVQTKNKTAFSMKTNYKNKIDDYVRTRPLRRVCTIGKNRQIFYESLVRTEEEKKTIYKTTSL